MVSVNSNPVAWSDSPTRPELKAGEVHVWRALLDHNSRALAKLESSLSPDECVRAGRFVLEANRKHFVMTRGVLRALLGRYLECSPQAIEFRYGLNGKPALGGRHSNTSICFNLSHSGGVALFAFALDRRIGIDLELVRPEPVGEAIAARYFSTQENYELCNLPTDQKTEGFFLCWTRKEAYVKAQGAGLRIPLDSFDVSLSPGQPATLSSSDKGIWNIQSFVPVSSEAQYYTAALVVEGGDHTITFFEWTYERSAEEDTTQ
jgi:4'-phosphopantetheinyl transferase